MTSRIRCRLCLAGGLIAALFVGATADAQAATVGKDRPITRTWKCENNRTVLINFNPRRVREEAWLTYGGDRAAVYRVQVDSGVAYASKDGKVQWHERGDDGVVEFEGATDKPVSCRRVQPERKTKDSKAASAGVK